MKLTLDNLKQALTQKGVRQTRKRDVILSTFLQMGGHRTIEELLKEARKDDPKIGYVTVYRTLKLLKDSGFAHQWQFGDGYSRFEQVSEHHDHLICLRCQKIIEFEEPKIEKLQEKIGLKYKFKISNHVHEIFGYCENCTP